MESKTEDSKEQIVEEFKLSDDSGDDLTKRFAALTKLITRDLNSRNLRKELFKRYTKSQITDFLENPIDNEIGLRDAVIYIYGASPHFRRLIQYFASLSDLAYVVSPVGIDPKTANARIVRNNYRKVLNVMSSMSVKTQFPKILTVCLREDVFYGTMWVTPDSITIQQLPSAYCKISSIEGNVFNVTFDFSYFDSRKDLLDFYPKEFRTKYETIYKAKTTNGRKRMKWIELDSPTSFAIKCNNDIPDYSVPPFAGLLREVYDIEDYKQLKLTRTEIENYAMIAMKLPMHDDGRWKIDLEKAKDFWSNLDNVLPEDIGSVLTPFDLQKVGFEKSNNGDNNTVAESEQNLFTAAGVSSLLFNNEKASANALLLSIKADQALTYGIVKSIQDVVNRYIQSLKFGKNFHVEFLDVSIFNRKEAGDAYLKAASYGMPTNSMYAASQGLGQAELDTMSFLEGDVLGLVDMFKPLRNSAQMSSVEADESGEGGAPKKDDSDITDSGEQSRENKDDWG